MNFKISKFYFQCRNLTNHVWLTSNFAHKSYSTLRNYSNFWNQNPTLISKSPLPVKLFKNLQISIFSQMIPKWFTDLRIHFRSRSQHQNRHTDLFPDSESQTDIDNTETHFNPNLWNSFKNDNFHNRCRNILGSFKTLFGHTSKSEIIIRTCWNLRIPIPRSFTQKSILSQFFQLKAFEMGILFPNQLRTSQNSILTTRTSHNTWS